MTRILDVRDLSVAFGDTVVLENVGFTLDAGECVGIVGETGSGKSMTCHVIAGTLSRLGGTVVGGRVDFDGTDLASLNENGWARLRGRRIALVPQGSMSGLSPVRKVGAHMREAVAVLEPQLARAHRGTRAKELLDSVGLRDIDRVLGMYPHQLSGGMRQRVMIALALVGTPDLLVADEPTTALDVTVQAGILDLMAKLRAERGLAMIFVTHDLGVVEQISDTVVVLHRGRVVEQGRTQVVLDAPAESYTKMLIEARLSATSGARDQEGGGVHE